MDELKIESKFMTAIVSRVIRKVIQDKLGCKLGLHINGFRAIVANEKTHVHLDLDLDISKEELGKILEMAGL